MKKLYLVSPLIILTVMTACKQQIKVTYPETRKVDSVDIYFGQKIADPYRWLENDTSKQTAAWVEAESDGTVTSMVSRVGVDPVSHPDTAILAMLLAA